MAIDVGTFDTLTMLEAINNTTRPRRFLMDLLFAGRFTTFPTEQILVDLTKGKRRMAPFVSPYIGGKVMERDGYSTQSYRSPLVQPRDILTPERLKERMAGESIVSAMSPADRAAAEQAKILAVFDDYITNREEWMVAQLLFAGAIQMTGEGVNELFSIGFTQTDTLTGADKWDQATADPIADIGTWRRAVMEATGITPNALIMGSDVTDVFLRHAAVQNLLDVRRMEMGTINPSQLPNGATYIGSLSRENVDIYEYVNWYVDDVSGLNMPMVPAGMLALVPTADRNPGAQMLYGAWTEMANQTTFEGQRIPRVWSEEGPNATFIEVVSRPLPLLPDVDAWHTATVI